ncbi:MAG TPA: SRPBCC domain-containing protein [Bryobacteraceae bacterium]|nr:SRPBCC domain-containing protein [Bryobacteraceae bacterium]
MRLFLYMAAISAAFGQRPVSVVKQAAPEKALIFEVLVPASPSAVWHAFATSDGLSTWLTPGAVVDLRPGGEWTAHYPGGKTGGGTIVSFVPEKEMVLSAMAPEQFPTVREQRTTATFQFSSKEKGTLVRLTQTGWKSGEEWDRAYQYLVGGNAELLEILRRRFVDGPIDWKKEWGLSK